MSFILDALRKSETERQRETQPVASHLPGAVGPQRLPLWAVSTMSVLALGILGLAVAWWLSSQPGSAGIAAGTSVQAASSYPARSEAPATRLSVTGNVAGSGPQTTANPSIARNGEAANAPRSLADASPSLPPAVATRAAVAESRTTQRRVNSARTSIVAPTTSPATRKTNAAPGRVTQAKTRDKTQANPSVAAPADTAASAGSMLPTYANLAASDPALPELTLQLHVYADDPAGRFIFINGTKYAQGDQLKEGPRVVRITPTGAVLSLRGRQFLLPRN